LGLLVGFRDFDLLLIASRDRFFFLLDRFFFFSVGSIGSDSIQNAGITNYEFPVARLVWLQSAS